MDISRILIQRLEGDPVTARVSSIEAANTVLERWSGCAPDDDSGNCDLEIVFEDGVRYHGHYRLRKSEKRISLSRHIRKQLTALATAKNAGKRGQEVVEPTISMIGGDQAESARIALEHYKI